VVCEQQPGWPRDGLFYCWLLNHGS
jgi:hypothetical protein